MIKGAIPKPVELPIPKCCLIFLSNFTAFFGLICLATCSTNSILNSLIK